jgi:type IV pilus assembly protein PilM
MNPVNMSGKSIVGVDIEPGYVAAVEGVDGRLAVERAAYVALPGGVVRDGEVVDVDTLAGALRELFAEHKLSKRVRLGVANHRIVMRMIDLPPLEDPKEIASAVRFQAQDHIPMPLDQAVLEHQPLGLVETADGTRMRVVLVAARRDMIDRLLEAATHAGLRPQGIDLSAFAMVRALHRPGSTATVAYVSVGGITNVAVASGTTCVFTRAIAQGTESTAGDLAERRALTLEHAHQWLRHVGLERPVEDVEGEREIVIEARAVLTDAVRRIGAEIRNTLDFHRMQEGSTPVDQVVLTGPGAAIDGFVDQLGEQLGAPVEIGVVPEAAAGSALAGDGHRYAVAAGLTVEDVSQ